MALKKVIRAEHVEGPRGVGEEDGGEIETRTRRRSRGNHELGGEARGEDVRGDAAEAEREERSAAAPVRLADVPVRAEGRDES